MRPLHSLQAANANALPEAELVRLARQGDGSALRVIMQRHNRRLYRVARSVVGDESEAEDVVQDAYVRVFTSLAEFRGDASLSSWLTRITLNEALKRLRRRPLTVGLAIVETLQEQNSHILIFPPMTPETDPEHAAGRQDIRELLERAIDDLPEPYRIVFVMRAVEEMSIEETARQLDLRPQTVKTRLHRARRLLRKALEQKLSSVFTDAFPFGGARCARTTEKVLVRMGIPSPAVA